jgi:hypothetical protein
MVLFVLGLVAMTFLFAGNAHAALPEQQPKGPAVLHSLADGNTILTDTTGLVCTWWRQLWECGNLYHIIEYEDNNDGVISTCDYIKVELTEAYGQQLPDPIESWLHIEWVTLTLKLRKIGFSDSMFVEFSGGIDSLARVVGQNPICTWWHEVWPEECKWWHIEDWKDNTSGSLDICDTLKIVHSGPPPETLWVHVEDIATDIWVVSQDPPGYSIPTMTEWGLVILAVLLLASALFIYLRRKRIMVSP